MVAAVRLKALLFVLTVTPGAMLKAPAPLASESASTMTLPVVVTLPLNVTAFVETTLTDWALIPADSRKLWELTTASAASGLADPTASVKVTSPAPAVIVSPSAVAVWLSTVLANAIWPPSDATALGLVRNVCVWKTMSPPVELTVVPIWTWSFAVTSSAANVEAPPLKATSVPALELPAFSVTGPCCEPVVAVSEVMVPVVEPPITRALEAMWPRIVLVS